MRFLRSQLIAFTALAALAAPASAHRQWLLPSATIFSGTADWVTVDAATSNDLFYADHNPMRTDGIKVWAPDGTPSQIQNAATGRYRSTFDVKLDKPGTWKIGTSQSSISGSFKVDGVEWRVGGRRPGGPPGNPNAQQVANPPQGAMGGAGAGGPPPSPSVASIADIPANATDIKLTEVSSRNEIFVTAGAPTNTVFQPTKKGLELVPITHPDELVSNEVARFRFLVDGAPAAKLKVSLVPGGKRYRDAEGALELITGDDGVVEIKWPMAGMFWLNASLTDSHPSEPRASDRRMSYTSTIEVLAP
jgi:uncharacterized GH25 family protein